MVTTPTQARRASVPFVVGAVVAMCTTMPACKKKNEQNRAATDHAARPSDRRFDEVSKVAWMEKHYDAAIVAHDKLIRADLDELRAQLATLSDRALPENAPESWGDGHEQLRQAAARATEVTDHDSAAAVMADVVRACGGCHAVHVDGPIYRRQVSPPDGSKPVTTHMLRHQWATERLWEGVTGPWEEAWTRGATALASSSFFADTGDAGPALLEREQALRELAAEALKTVEYADRTEIYGRLLATCAGCHRESDVDFADR